MVRDRRTERAAHIDKRMHRGTPVVYISRLGRGKGDHTHIWIVEHTLIIKEIKGGLCIGLDVQLPLVWNHWYGPEGSELTEPGAPR